MVYLVVIKVKHHLSTKY